MSNESTVKPKIDDKPEPLQKADAASDYIELYMKCQQQEAIIAKLKAVVEFYADSNNYNHFPATSDPNCMAFVGFIEEKEAGEKARETLASATKKDGESDSK